MKPAVPLRSRLDLRVRWLMRALAALLALSAVVGGLWALIVLGLGRVPTGQQTRLLVLSALAAGLAALAYGPARERLTWRIERIFYGEGSRPDEALRVLRDPRSRAIPLDELMLQVAEALRRGLGLVAAEIWTGAEGALARTVSDPAAPVTRLALSSEAGAVVARSGLRGRGWASTWLPGLRPADGGPLRVASLAHAGQLLGLLVAERSAEERPFADEEDEILADLAREVALVLHNARLDFALQASLDELRRHAEELRASRARIVASADAERRRIERDLHDGAQQRMISLMVRVREARDLIAADREGGLEALSRLDSELQGAIDEVRDLAQGIYPPLLADEGLAEALPAAAARAGIPCRVECDGIGRYPPDVETAVYFCCIEALQNAAKHAGEGARARIRVRGESRRLAFTVEDDGVGFEAEGRPYGLGLTNMGDRLGAIGGQLIVESAPGVGTTVAGSVPLPV